MPELQNTININGDIYDITAKKSEEAVHAILADKAINSDEANRANELTNSLIIKNIGLEGTVVKETCFNGKNSEEISIVPASGGRFSGRIKVVKNTNKTIDKEAILNYEDILDRVVPNLINRSVFYRWNGEELSSAIEEAVNSISIVCGEENNIEGFSEHNNTSSEPLTSYLYICSDSGNIYFGTVNSAAARIAQSAINSENAKSATTLIHTDGTGKADFTAEHLSSILDNLQLQLTDIKYDETNPNAAKTLVAKAHKADEATSAGKATTADKAIGDSQGNNILTNYYRSADNKNTNSIMIEKSSD